MNNIAAKRDSTKRTIMAVEGAKVRILKIKIFCICTSFPTKLTMLIMNMKEIL